MTVRKHIILVHGRSSKPSEREKRRLVRKTLLHGLARSSPEAAEAVSSREVRFTLAYFGDVSNRILMAKDPGSRKWLTATDPKHPGTPCEEAGSYDESLEKLLARPSNAFTRKAYRKFLGEVKDNRYLDEAATIISAVAGLIGLNDEMIRRTAPDMNAYLTSRLIGSDVRVRLQRPLARALRAGDDICLIGHSMGCLVAYDVLWKFSRMSEYASLRDKSVSLWLTLGNPLGERGVQRNLYDSNEPDDGRYPKGIVDTWINISAYDDFIAHDEKIGDDFRVMLERRYVRRIVDRPKIYTFWEGFSGANPHKLYAYLDHPKVGAELARWILR